MNKIFVSAIILILFSSQACAEPFMPAYAMVNLKCTRAVEVTLYEFEWTESLFEMKFKFLLHDKVKNFSTYATEKIRFKNDFGVWRHHICFCAWDVLYEQVLGVGCQDKGF